MSLADIKHQGSAQRLIQRAMRRDRVPHAYLFHGPDGVGKEALALGLAQVLLCSQPADVSVDPGERDGVGVERLRMGCNKCEECHAVGARVHPDLHLIYRQLNREHPDSVIRRRKALEISVDVLRHFVIDKVGLTPARGRAKVFIIREADRMTTAAQNALLKTLEEPPSATVIILLVHAVDRLLPTTLSRCQVVRFDALPVAFVQEKLAELLPDQPVERLGWYARCSEGSLGRAVQCASDNLYEINQLVIEGLLSLPGRRSDAVVKVWTEESRSLGDRYRGRDPDISDTEAAQRGFRSIFQLAATWYADLLRWGSGDSSGVVNTNLSARIEEAARSTSAEQACGAVSRIVQAERQLDLHVNTQLCVETLLNDLAHVGVDRTVRAT